MNLFTKYGIKEVANVMIYSIKQIGDEEFYMPVLFLDTLKISNIEKKEQKVTASSGYGNTKIMGWNFGKDITLKIQDALFTPASLSMCWGGWLEGKMSIIASIIAKISIRNKYKNNNYSIYAYPSPELTPEEWREIYRKAWKDFGYDVDTLDYYRKDTEYIEKNRVQFQKSYYRKIIDNDIEEFWKRITLFLIRELQLQKQNIDTKLSNTEFIDRSEMCNSFDKEIVVNYEEQFLAYQSFLTQDYSSSFVLFLDCKNFQPLFLQANSPQDFIIKPNTKYLKLIRERYTPKANNNSSYGKNLIISCDTFPGYYRIVGETKIREQITGQDQILQFIIPKAKLSGDTNIKLEAAGEPTVFDMNIDVICPENDIMFEIKEFEVEKDCTHGGTHIIPQIAEYSYTPVYQQTSTIEETDIDDNIEIY